MSGKAKPKEEETHNLRKLMHETTVKDGGEHKSLWQMTKETMGMAEGGKTKSTDTLVDTEPEALEAIRKMVQEAKEKDNAKKHSHPLMWDFEWTIYKEFNATLDDVLLAFCRWTRKDNKDRDKTTMNVNKAFRRLENYAQWMYDAREDLTEPLTVDSFKGAAKAFDMKLTRDSSGRMVWWLDLPKTDLDALKNKTITASETMRYIVWSAHVVLFDKDAQVNGLHFIQDMKGVSFWKFLTSFPSDLGPKVDRLTIGVMPIQMKGMYVLNADGYMRFLLGFMKAFMSKKMRQRIVTFGKKDDTSAVLMDVVGGAQYVPISCCGLEGTAEKDIIFGTYITD